MPVARKQALRGGIDLGGTKIQAAIVSPEGEVSGEARRPTPTKGGPKDVAAEMAAALVEAADDAGVQTDSLAGIGVGSPVDTNEQTGEVSDASNLPGWAEATFPLGAALSDALGAPVLIANDVDVATNAEFKLGAGEPYDSLLGVFWGTGVGGGLILDGKRWTGRGAAGEIGHMVVERGGARCPCGRRGCMEAYAGRAAMEAKARRDHADGVEDEAVQDHEGPRPRSSDQRAIWERALARRPAGREADRAGAEGARRGRRLGGQPARRRGRDHRRRARRPPRSGLRRQDRQRDAAAPVRRRPPAGDASSPRSATSAARSAPRCSSTTDYSGSHGWRQPPWPCSRFAADSGPQPPGS